MAKLSNKFWFNLHGWCSLPIWLIFCVVCLTGTISVVSHELTWLTNQAARATNPQQLPAKPVNELVEIVQQAYPTAKISSVMKRESYLVTPIVFTDSDKPYAIAYVNQYSGDIQQINQDITFIGFMRSLHGWLLFPWQNSYSVGYYLVCAMAFVMLGALITGLMIYKNFWRAFTQPKLRFHQGKKTLLADLHRLAGVWSMWFLVLMSISGLWYLTQAIFWHNQVDIEPHAPLIPVSQVPMKEVTTNNASIPANPVSLQDAIAIAKQRYPDFKTSYVMLPEHNRDNYHLSGTGDFIFYDSTAYKLTITPWTGVIESDIAPHNMTLLQTLMHIADPLHYGTIGGLFTKFIWFVFGILLSGMSITGFLIWGSRTVKAGRREQPVATTSQPVDSLQPADILQSGGH